MVELTEEMKELAKAAATGYVAGLGEQNAKQAVDHFLDAYDYSTKKIWLRSHKENALKDITSATISDEDK